MYEKLRAKIINFHKQGLITEIEKDNMLQVLREEEQIEKECTKELYKEAVKIYESFITQFYSYRTKSYIRHGESTRGTGKGHSLYFAQNFIKEEDAHQFSFDIGFSADEMRRAPDMDKREYQHGDVESVLNDILSGYRFKHIFEGSDGKTKRKVMRWSGKYYDDLFDIDKATVYQAFEQFDKTYDDMWIKLYSRKWKEVK